uniref:Type VII secretion-associated serine protease mycosin n=1 Tax=Streptomyces sp. NBC_00003 TaxID=2903608 RepID=A0AAU2V2Y0_9ACTN
MPTSSRTRSTRRRPAAAAVLGVFLIGSASVPAQAESVRSQQWFLDAMKAEEMWRTSTGKGITVAVIDTGVDAAHPDLQGRVLPGKDLATDKPGDAQTDYDGHGTGMAGLIAGTGARAGGNGAYGLAPGAKILPVRLPRKEGNTQAEGDKQGIAAIATGIRLAADVGAKVISVSQGAPVNSPELTTAVKHALDKGALVFAAVGNEGDQGNPVEYPAATPGVVGVAAVGKDLRRTGWSEYGSQVDISAPGEGMLHACGGKTGLCRTDGTSDATALASASAALIWSAHPDWTNNQVLRVLLNTIGAPTSGPKRNDSLGYGIVRPRIALTTPGNPGPADEYPLPDLAASASPSSKASSSSQPTGDPKPNATARAANPEDNNPTLWVCSAIGGVVGLGTVAWAVVVRRRRRAETV